MYWLLRRVFVYTDAKLKKTSSNGESSDQSTCITATLSSFSAASELDISDQESPAACPEAAESSGAPILGQDAVGTTATTTQPVADMMASSLNQSVQLPLSLPGETFYPSMLPAVPPSIACPPFNSFPWVMFVSPQSVTSSGLPNLEPQSGMSV